MGKAYVIVVFLGVFCLGIAHAAIPLMINHQGIVKVNGEPFSGNGLFKFGFIDSTGLWLWTNDGTRIGQSAGLTTPDASVSLAVSNGVYNLRLGDAGLLGMTAIPSTTFDADRVTLRVMFNDGTHGWQVLTPDQPVTSGAYAFHAADADTVGGRTPEDLGPPSFYGDGSDGEVTISTDTTLTRDMYYTRLTVNSGVTLRPDGYRIFCRESLNNNGVLSAAGGPGANAVGRTTPGTGGVAGATSHMLGGGTVGGAGGFTSLYGDVGAGAGLPGGAPAWGLGGNGGDGGLSPDTYGGSMGGGAGGSITNRQRVRYVTVDLIGGSPVQLLGGGGSGGGGAGGFAGSGATQPYQGGCGGGGGGAGGIIMICAKSLVNNGLITAEGGRGGNGSAPSIPTASGGAGGGGGGGGAVYLVYDSILPGTISASGGAAGLTNTTNNPRPGAVAGGNGSVMRYNALARDWE